MEYKIIDFQDCHQKDFARLNYHWIEKFFEVEEVDRQALDHPREKIYTTGGHILLMQHGKEIVAAVALIKKETDYFELAKMAVSEEHQGKGLGYKLGMAALLYEKMGFEHIVHKPTPYCRCDVQMEIKV